MNNKHCPILIVSATQFECEPTRRKIVDCKKISSRLYSGTLYEHPVELLITGIGSVATTFWLTQTLLQRSYYRAISIGIAGSFSDDINIGETVQITEDCFADLGIDDNGVFRTLREASLTCDKHDCDFISNPFPLPSSHQNVRGITVQTTSGSQQRIDTLERRLKPKVETMENAAFFFVCSMMQLPFATFRAISNRVEPRNRNKWRVEEAIENVNECLLLEKVLFLEKL